MIGGLPFTGSPLFVMRIIFTSINGDRTARRRDEFDQLEEQVEAGTILLEFLQIAKERVLPA